MEPEIEKLEPQVSGKHKKGKKMKSESVKIENGSQKKKETMPDKELELK